MKRTIIAWSVFVVAVLVCGLTMIGIGYPVSTYQYWIVLSCLGASFLCGEERELGRHEKKTRRK